MTPCKIKVTSELIPALADKYADLLLFMLKDREIEEMKRRNALPEYHRDLCASHDFCDANMVMAEAFEAVVGRAPDVGGDTPESQADIALWNDAWQLAKDTKLTAKANEEAR